MTSLNLKQRFTLVFFFIIFVSLSIVGYYGYHNTMQASIERAFSLNEEEVFDLADDVSDSLDDIPSDIRFFNDFYALYRYIFWEDIGEPREAKRAWDTLTDSLESFMESIKNYKSIQYIDISGEEKLSIYYSRQTGKATTTPQRELQNRKDTPYFRKALTLKKDEISVSPLKLHRGENGDLTEPYQPVISYFTPVIDKNNVKHGVLIFNVYAEHFLRFIENAEIKAKAVNMGHFFMVKRDGSYVVHSNKTKLWGDDLGHGESLKTDYPNLFRAILSQESGRLLKGDKLYSFAKAYPLQKNSGNFWVVVKEEDKSLILKDVKTFQRLFFLIMFLVLSAVLFLINRFIESILTPLGLVTENLKNLSAGKVTLKKVQYHKDDEIGDIVKSVNTLSENALRTTRQANDIALGNYSRRVELLSEEDTLGIALNNMTEALERNEQENKRKSWIEGDINTLSSEISGDLNLTKLSQTALDFLAQYLGAGHGVLYLYKPKENILRLKASFAFTEKDELLKECRLGEGTLGQAALEKRPILLTNLTKEDAVISTGTVKAIPLNTYSMPILYEGKLYGALELATTELFTEEKQTFLEEALKVIAINIYTGMQNEQVKELLALSEEATIDAQRKAEELQEINTQMEEQQQQLQQQSEELQQANTQMEEQQQQLRQQTLELQQKNETLIASQKEIDRRSNELELSNKYKSEFLANMSHELRTPLNSVILLSKMLSRNEEKRLSEDDVKKATIINSAGKELLRLINDILDISKIEAGKMLVNVSQLSSRDACIHMQDFFESTATERGLHFVVEDRFNGEFSTDKEKLFQILRNLLSNSFKFTEKGEVRLLFEKSDNAERPLVISVIDTGIGIPEEKQGLVFEAFKQVDGSITREYGGTGLGLSIVQQYTALLEGEITLESHKGKGSRFSLHLPLELKKEDDEAGSQKSVRTENKSILIIEDDKVFSQIVEKEAEKLGFKPLVAHSGDDGIRLCKEKLPDVIILDLGLPDKSGIEVLRELRSITELSQTPVYIISGRDEKGEAEESNVVGYLQKPVATEEIDHAIEELFQRAEKLSGVKAFHKPYLRGDRETTHKQVLKGKTVLVVDDDVKNIFVLSSALEEEGAKVVDAINGRKALEKLKKEQVDLILMDIMMPEMDGYETMRAIRKDKKLKSIPIIAVTAKAMKEDKAKCIEAGANDYITKPVDYDTLILIAREWSNKKV